MAFFHFDSLLSEADASLEMRTSEHQCVLLGDKRDLWASGGGGGSDYPACWCCFHHVVQKQVDF